LSAASLERREVVTAFLRHEGKILLLRRSDRVGTYRGRWAGISGYLEDPTPLDQALREIREETGLASEQVVLAGVGSPLEIPAPELGRCWIVHPFLFDVMAAAAIQLDWEHCEMVWVVPEALADYATVPGLAAAFAACLTDGGN
jgi:8-oxo-dGTP pyrophosphatase MutT (NUDIX family)